MGCAGPLLLHGDLWPGVLSQPPSRTAKLLEQCDARWIDLAVCAPHLEFPVLRSGRSTEAHLRLETSTTQSPPGNIRSIIDSPRFELRGARCPRSRERRLQRFAIAAQMESRGPISVEHSWRAIPSAAALSVSQPGRSSLQAVHPNDPCSDDTSALAETAAASRCGSRQLFPQQGKRRSISAPRFKVAINRLLPNASVHPGPRRQSLPWPITRSIVRWLPERVRSAQWSLWVKGPVKDGLARAPPSGREVSQRSHQAAGAGAQGYDATSCCDSRLVPTTSFFPQAIHPGDWPHPRGIPTTPSRVEKRGCGFSARSAALADRAPPGTPRGRWRGLASDRFGCCTLMRNRMPRACQSIAFHPPPSNASELARASACGN